MILLAALAIFSGISLNLLLSFALGTQGLAAGIQSSEQRKIPFYQMGVIFTSLIALWIIFYNIFPFLLGGFFEFFLLFPVSSLCCMGLELLGEKVILKHIKYGNTGSRPMAIRKYYSAYTAYEGLVPIALFIILNLAWNFAGVFIMALFFALGNLLAIFILNEVNRKAKLEAAPHFLQGNALILITIGLLSFILASLAGISLGILGLN